MQNIKQRAHDNLKEHNAKPEHQLQHKNALFQNRRRSNNVEKISLFQSMKPNHHLN